MTTGLHRNLELDEIHRPYSWEYDDAIEREAATGFEAGDIGKLALQTDDFTYWYLTATTPTWEKFGGGGILASEHKVLRQLIHFIDSGPAEGFASGAYRVITGTPFPTSIIWYDSNGVSKKKIVEKTLSYTGINPTTIIWKVYDAAEVLLATVTDTVSYSGVFETSRLRAIT